MVKIRGNTDPKELSEELDNLLQYFRKTRNFDVEEYIAQKVALIDRYFAFYGLKSAVIGVSGGLDSAVALTLIQQCKNIEEIVPVLMPAYKHDGVSNQETAALMGEKVCNFVNLTPSIIDMSKVAIPAQSVVEQSINNSVDSSVLSSQWSRGQFIPYLRTSVLYYHTSLLTDNGSPAVIIGTTNFSEGGYLGYIGKASDGMVDLQVISDIYKNEVYQLAEFFGLPHEIISRKPTGDMFEDISDEEVFGTTYDFVELFMETKGIDSNEIMKTLSTQAYEEYMNYAESLEEMHKYNKHKYLGSSPAVHLDVIKNNLKVWKINTWKGDNENGKTIC